MFGVQDVPYEEAKKTWEASHDEPINVWLDNVTLPDSFSKTTRPSIFIEFLNDKVHTPCPAWLSTCDPKVFIHGLYIIQ